MGPRRVLGLVLAAGLWFPPGAGPVAVQRPTASEAGPGAVAQLGRAPDLQSGGRRFDSDQLHQGNGREARRVGPVAQVARAHP